MSTESLEINIEMNMDRQIYDLVIVGAGMIGSAAARYASMRKDINVYIIGPDEPTVSIIV